MVAPVKHKTVMSIDPGFSNGCKVAVIDKHGMHVDNLPLILYSLTQNVYRDLLFFFATK